MTDTEIATPNIRRIAEGRHYALGHRDATVQHVSAGTFWAIWRDGCNWALANSAKMSTLFQEVSEQILLMSQARDAAPADPGVYAVLRAILEDPDARILDSHRDDGWSAIRQAGGVLEP